MHTTVEQNKAHRDDVQWVKSPGRQFRAGDESYISEYVNQFTGQAIRKSWRMTGHDWHVFDAEGNRTTAEHSLTWAKFEAAQQLTR